MSRRVAIRSLVELPSWVYQWQPQLWNRLLLAGGWSLLYVLCSGGAAAPPLAAVLQNPAFPSEWRIALAVLVFLLGLWQPIAGYAAFIVAVAYPLYLVSIYVMALALAVLIMLLPVMARYSEQGVLFLVLLVLLTPALAPLHLAPLVPLLAGLWWEGAGGWVAGGLAALWLKLVAGMSGHSVDLWQISGWTLDADRLYERFHAANSLQTVVLLVEPLGMRLGRVPIARGIELGAAISYPIPAGMFVLYNLLQVFAWAAVGAAVSLSLDALLARPLGAGQMGGGRGWGLSALSLAPGLLLI